MSLINNVIARAIQEEIAVKEMARTIELECQRCGKTIIYRPSSPGNKPKYCSYCKKVVREEERMADERNKYEIRFDRAIEEITKQIPIEECSRAIEIARKRIYDYDSIPEAMVAIELVRIGCRVIPQQKVLKYHVDFLLPDDKLVLEVDGDIYHQRGTDREPKIQLALGLDWEIIHLPAEAIRKNIKAIDKCIEVRRRRKNE